MYERHGKSRSNKLYNTWRGMKERCLLPTSTNYPRYGGRGIKLCEEWVSFAGFEDWAKRSGYQEGMTIERWDVNFHYQPSNCRWVTPKEQAQNRRDSCLVTINFETKSVAAWAEQTGISASTLYQRYKKGIRGEEFIKRPLSPSSTKETTE